MATPNVSVEQSNKAALRGVTRGGSNPWYEGVDPAIMVNALAQASGVLELVVPSTNTYFTISGTGGNSANISGATAQVSGLVAALSAGPLNGVPFYVNAGGANYLKNTTTTIIVPSGAVLTVISGGGTTPTLTALTFSGSNGEAVTYPNYVGAPNAVPTWIDDATVHAYQVTGQGAIVQDTTRVVQTQVRQIQTNISETQQYDGYLASYSGNLYVTGQKRTYRQQS